MKKSTSLENKSLPRLPLVSRTQVPLTTLSADGPSDLDFCSYVISCDRQESSGSPIFNLCEESAVLSFSFGPEDQSETSFSREPREVTAGDASLLDNISTESKWLKYQNIPQCNLTTTNRVDKVTDGSIAEADAGMHFSDTGERQSNAANESSLDSLHLQMIKGMLHQQQQDFSSQDLVSRKKTLSLNLKQTSRTEEIQNTLGESAYYNYSVTGDLQVRKCTRASWCIFSNSNCMNFNKIITKSNRSNDFTLGVDGFFLEFSRTLARVTSFFT